MLVKVALTPITDAERVTGQAAAAAAAAAKAASDEAARKAKEEEERLATLKRREQEYADEVKKLDDERAKQLELEKEEQRQKQANPTGASTVAPVDLSEISDSSTTKWLIIGIIVVVGIIIVVVGIAMMGKNNADVED